VSINVAPSMSDIPTWPSAAKGGQPVPQELLRDSDNHHEYLPNVDELPPLPVWNPQWPPTAVATDCGSVHTAGSPAIAATNCAQRGTRLPSPTTGPPELRPRTFRRPKGCASMTATGTIALNHREHEDQEEAIATKGHYCRAVPQGSGCAGVGSRTSTAATSTFSGGGGAASSTSGMRTASSLSNGFGEDGGQRPSPVQGHKVLPNSPRLAAAEAAKTPEAALSPQVLPHQQSSRLQHNLLPRAGDLQRCSSVPGSQGRATSAHSMAGRPSGHHFDPSSSVAPCGADGFDIRRSNAGASRAAAVAPPPLPERFMAMPSSWPEKDGGLVQVDHIVHDESDSNIRNSFEQKAVSVKHHNPNGLNNNKFSELARAFALLDDIT